MIRMVVSALLGWKRGHRWAVLLQSSLQRYTAIKCTHTNKNTRFKFMWVPLNIKGAFGSKQTLSPVSDKFKFKTTPFLFRLTSLSRGALWTYVHSTPIKHLYESSCLNERELVRRVVYLIINAGCVLRICIAYSSRIDYTFSISLIVYVQRIE